MQKHIAGDNQGRSQGDEGSLHTPLEGLKPPVGLRFARLLGMGAAAGGTGRRVPRFKIFGGLPPEIVIFADLF